ncbi:DoxX family protein [Pelagibacterium xiamenense]|uniref:DoxX family protein n=1 Tax=Pelagibacterium xiamenense TaxID=2901140 RepID=UPI001E6355C1|nr:DoxX family protein [Pelagibacterium xiamenense]
MTDISQSQEPRFIVPALSRLYALGTPIAETVLRVATGAALMMHGSGKILNPLGSAGMIENMVGLYPGWFWAPLHAGAEFIGGALLILGLLTRPAAFAAMIVLLVTVYLHWVVMGQGYSGAELSILWSAILFYFAMRGGNRFSVDARIGRQF